MQIHPTRSLSPRMPTVRSNENNREDKTGDDRPDGQERAGGAGAEGEQRYHPRRQQRQK